MNIESYRSSFTVFVLDSELKRGQSLSSSIENIDYDTKLILNESDFKDQLNINPPHIVLLHYGDPEFCIDAFATKERIQKLLLQLPELHIVLLAADEDLEECSEFYSDGIYALLSYPIYPENELVKCLDRAAMQNYYMYLNEQLRVIEPGAAAAQMDYFEIWAEGMRSAKTPTEWIANTLKEISRVEPQFYYIYFKFIEAKASLIVENSQGISLDQIDSVGIDLKSTEPHFKVDQLLYPEKLLGLIELVKSGLKKPHFFAHPCIADKRIDGVLVGIPVQSEMPVQYNESYVRVCLRILGMQLALLEARNKLQKYSVVDESSSALNRSFFIQKINEEIVRARRILKPISLLIVNLDKYYDGALSAEEFEVDRLMKAFTAILAKNSRLNDLIGRLDNDQFGLLLPHTDIRGAAIKAERLRRIIESADFDKVFPQKPNFTISIGISEYPSMSHNGSDLLKKADEALSEVLKKGFNKVCIATASAGFEPDFEIKADE